MGLAEQAWWKKMFKKRFHAQNVDMLENIKAVKEFLQEAHQEINAALPLLDQLEELEKERRIAREALAPVNLQSQSPILDNLLDRYEFLQNDTDINGLRVKKIAQQFLDNAKKAEQHDLLEAKKKDMRWKFDW